MAAVADHRHIGPCPPTPEGTWRRWLDAQRPEPLALDRAARLVVVSPHPDDEVLACGGLIARHAAQRGTVSIVAVTDGEASHLADRAWPPERLARERRSERIAGLARLGVDRGSIVSLGLGDGAVAARQRDLAQQLRQHLRSTDVVVSTWALDGHPDHDATGREARAACTEIGCRLLAAPVWMWHWSRPADPRVPWERLRTVTLSPDERQAKRAALECHVTQRSPRAKGADGAAAPVLDAAILARAERRQEYFFD